MRSYSLFTILLLCLGLLLVDIMAFYWLQSITLLLATVFYKKLINIVFWVFTIGLIIAILILKIKLDDINPQRKHKLISSLYGLTISSFIPKILFVIIISILFFSNFIFSEKESILIIPLVGLLSGLLPFLIIIYGIFKSVYHFKIHRHMISFEHLPKFFDGLKIVQISDLHLGGFNFQYKTLEKAIELINNLKPDLIFITGDLVNNYAWELKGWDKVFLKLKARINKYAVLGNHDYGDYSKWKNEKEKQNNFNLIKKFYKDVDIKLLLNESEIINTSNETIAIVGVENWGKPSFKQYGNLKMASKNINNIPFKILLSHDPTHWAEEIIDKTNIDLTLSGHTHGMQAAINFNGNTWSPIKYKYKHWAGLYKHKKQYLHVNRGLGWIGFPGRLGMRPEITFLQLNSRNKSAN